MKLKYCLLFLSLLYFAGCSSENDSGYDDWTTLKKLEFSRSTDLDAYKNIYSGGNSALKIETLRSIGRVKHDIFIPYLKKILSTEKDPEILKSAVFAIGQIGSADSEEILLNLPFSSLALSVQKNILLTLGKFGGDNAVQLFQRVINNPELQNEALIAAALAAKRGISVSDLVDSYVEEYPVTAEFTYLYSFAAKQRDLDMLVSLLSSSDVNSVKYLLKRINVWYSKDAELVTEHILSDSIQFKNMDSSLTAILKPETPWQTSYYALQLLPIVADSTDIELLKGYASGDNFHLKIASLRALAKISGEKSIAFLLNLMNETEDLYLKAETIKIISHINKNLAYRYVMQNLDQGNDAFKQSLLETLSMLNMPMATETLHQFVNVASPALAEKSFSLLADKNQARQADFTALLESESFSSVAMAIDWKFEHKQPVPFNLLLDLYSKFRQPSSSELQLSIIKLMRQSKYDLSASELQILADNASHPHVLSALDDLIGNTGQFQYKADSLKQLTPAYLAVDSLSQFDANPMVIIQTEKGAMTLELYPEIAPLTVHNFLTIVNNKFYHNLNFHRVVADFVIQGGDPMGNGWGGPGYTIPSEHSDRSFKRGSAGIATSGWDTGGCQFFICQSEQFHLNGNYTLFGQVVEGLDVIDRIVPGDKIIRVDMVR